MPLKTNHIYATLAYRKSVLQETIAFLQRQFIGAGGSEPKSQIVCEDVFSVDSTVPVEDVQQFVHDLQQLKLQVELEMSEYDFHRKMNGQQRHGTGNSTTAHQLPKSGAKPPSTPSPKGTSKAG